MKGQSSSKKDFILTILGIVVVALAVATSCGQETTPEKKDRMETRNPFVGTWALVSWEAQTEKGDTEHPFGKDAAGWIMYDGEGNMSVNVMRRGRPHFSTDDPAGGTAEEIEAAYNGYLAYCGTYTVQESTRTITHSLKGSLFPNWVGSELVRHFEFSEDKLTLSTPPIAGSTHVLVWRRI